ncbi:MAG: response regulator transcription factor [Clostridium sp.]|nr:response regulator transcription factor [Clostridium sp.]
MLSVIICDDSYEINDDLFEIIEEYFRQKEIPVVIQQYYDSKKLIETMPFFDIMFLDIEMPKYNGIEVAKAFRKKSSWGQIIYVTSYAQYAQTAYSVHAFGYITKPVNENSISSILDEALKYLGKKSPHNRLSIMTEMGVKHVAIEDIYYFETYERKVRMVSKDGKYIFKGTIEEIYKKIDQSIFACPHQSFLVNFLHIDYLKGYDIFIDNGDLIPLSQKRTVEFKKKYYDFLEDTYYMI